MSYTTLILTLLQRVSVFGYIQTEDRFLFHFASATANHFSAYIVDCTFVLLMSHVWADIKLFCIYL